jgi:hypothetical protein
MHLISLSEEGYQLERYLSYLQQVRTSLPEGTQSFALADWHYNLGHRRCPHDSWLEMVTLRELSQGTRMEIRELEITAKFLGAFHDGFFEITYRGVQSYSLVLPKERGRSAVVAHGDWIIDEILLTEEGGVSHEILFSESGVWKIVCRDLVYEWSDIQQA